MNEDNEELHVQQQDFMHAHLGLATEVDVARQSTSDQVSV
jgi:hypothetical protein